MNLRRVVNWLPLIFSGFLIVIVGCSPKLVQHECRQTPKQQQKISCDDTIKQFVREQEAKLMDIPIPLDAEPIHHYFRQACTEESCSLGYMSGSDLEVLKLFYIQEMERLGWRNTILVDTVESLLCFEKPTRFCIVSLRPTSKDGVTIIIFAGQ